MYIPDGTLCISVISLLKSAVLCMYAKSLQSSPILYDRMDSSLPGSSVHGILQVRTLDLVTINSFSKLMSLFLFCK